MHCGNRDEVKQRSNLQTQRVGLQSYKFKDVRRQAHCCHPALLYYGFADPKVNRRKRIHKEENWQTVSHRQHTDNHQQANNVSRRLIQRLITNVAKKRLERNHCREAGHEMANDDDRGVRGLKELRFEAIYLSKKNPIEAR